MKVGWTLFALLACLLVVTSCTGQSLIAWGDGWSSTAVGDGVVYVGTRDTREIVALDANKFGRLEGEAQVIWRFAPRGDERLGAIFGKAAVGEDFLYVADGGDRDGNDARLYALSKLGTGREDDSDIRGARGEWWADIEGAVVGGPTLAEAEGLVLIGSDDGNLYAFHTRGKLGEDADTGRRLIQTGDRAWRFSAKKQVWSSPAISDGVAYFGSMDHHVYAVEVQNGKELWKYKTGGALVSSPLILDEMVVVGSFDRKLYALDSRSGQLLWSFEGDGWFWAGPVSDGHNIFAPSMGGTVYALDPRNGSKVWSFKRDPSSPIVSTPTIVRNLVVVGNDGGELYRLDADTGEPLGRVMRLGDKPIKAPLTTDGNMVFVGLEDNSVRGVNVEDWDEIWQYPPEG